MKTHMLKSWPEYFRASVEGQKDFEVRKNDRDFEEGDRLTLLEWSPIKRQYTGAHINAVIGRVFKLDALGYDGIVVFNVIGWHSWTDDPEQEVK